MGKYILTAQTSSKPFKTHHEAIRGQKRHDKTYAKHLTKYRKAKRQKELSIILLVALIIFIANIAMSELNYLTIRKFQIKPNYERLVERKLETVLPVIADGEAEAQKVSAYPTAIREVTRYNAGDPAQTDSTPCVGAMGTNICEKLAQGKKICAANFVKLGTVINIEGYGDCVVEDRMNKRFPERVDIAMQAHEKSEAIKAGLKHLKVIIK